MTEFYSGADLSYSCVIKLLKDVLERQDLFAKQIEDVMHIVQTNQLTQVQQESKFEACAKGFHQVKMACEALLERLDEYGGVITEQTWNH